MKKHLIQLAILTFVLAICQAHASADQVELDRIVVTPNRTAEDAAAASSYVTIIGRSEIESSNARSIADILERTAGAHIYNQGTAKSTIVDLRGYGDTAARNVLVLINGRRTNPADISGPDYLQIPLETVERIEIIRGSASVLYGDNATGGVINIITKEGRGKFHGTLFSDFGSYQAQKYGVEAGGSLDKFSYYAYSGFSDTNGYRQNSYVRANDQQARFSYKISDLVKMGFEGGWHKDNYGLPGGLSGAEIESLGRRASADPNNFANSKDNFIKIATELTPFAGGPEAGKLTIDYALRDRDTLGFLDYGFGFTQETKRKLKTEGVSAEYAATREIAARPLSLTAGIDYMRDRNHIWSDSGDDLTITKRSLGLFINGNYEVFDRFFFEAGARQENAKYLFDQFNVVNHSVRTPKITVYSGGLKYEYARGSNVFLRTQKTFRFLATDEWFSTFTGLNTSLEQQSGMEWQAGIKHNIAEALEISWTPFYIRNKNEIFLDPTLGGGFGDNGNYDRTERLGFDIGGQWNALKLIDIQRLDRLHVSANYTYEEAKFGTGTFKGKRIPMVPEHQLVLGVDLGFACGLSLHIAERFIGSQFPINDTFNAASRVEPYALTDVKLSYAMKCGLETYFGINNLFDRRYFNYVVKSASSSNRDFFPAPERNFTVGLKYKF